MIWLGAIVLGIVNVVSKSVNFQATLYLGKWSGTLMNYIIASLVAFSLCMIMPGQLSFDKLVNADSFLYLGGVFGVIAFFFNVTSLNTMNLFMSTLIILSGQMLGATLLDVMFGHGFNIMKLLGVSLILMGSVWDKKLIMNHK